MTQVPLKKYEKAPKKVNDILREYSLEHIDKTIREKVIFFFEKKNHVVFKKRVIFCYSIMFHILLVLSPLSIYLSCCVCIFNFPMQHRLHFFVSACFGITSLTNTLLIILNDNLYNLESLLSRTLF